MTISPDMRAGDEDHDRTVSLITEAYAEGRPILAVAAEMTDLGEQRLARLLDPAALTIGFARRFATYKRGTLIMKNMDCLETILLNRERPVQIIFAGKAHFKNG